MGISTSGPGNFVVRGGVAQRRGRPDKSIGPGGGSDQYVRPTGTSAYNGGAYVTWESLHVGGELLPATMNRGTSGTILTLPADGNGVPSLFDFTTLAAPTYVSLRTGQGNPTGIPKMAGLMGSGLNLTTIQVVANSNTVTQAQAEQGTAPNITNQMTIMAFYAATNPEVGGFTLNGSVQNNGGTTSPYYNGLSFVNGSGGYVHDMKLNDCAYGYASVNPGETFMGKLQKQDNMVWEDVEFAGATHGASLFGINNSTNFTGRRINVHDAVYGAGVAHYQLNGVVTWVDSSTKACHSPQMNMERCGTTANSCTVNYVRHTFDGAGVTHIAIANDLAWGTHNIYDPILTGGATTVKIRIYTTYNSKPTVQTTSSHGLGTAVNCWTGGVWNDATGTYTGGTLNNALLTVTT